MSDQLKITVLSLLLSMLSPSSYAESVPDYEREQRLADEIVDGHEISSAS
jgi:hypothetical protein